MSVERTVSEKNVLDLHKGGRRGHKNLFKSIGLTLRYLHSVTEMLINGIHILNAVLTGLLLSTLSRISSRELEPRKQECNCALWRVAVGFGERSCLLTLSVKHRWLSVNEFREVTTVWRYINSKFDNYN